MKRKALLVILIFGIAIFVAARRPAEAPQAAFHPVLPTPSPTTTSSAVPTAAPNDSTATQIDGAIARMDQGRPMHVVFNGADAGGAVAFDIVTDGVGDVQGTYARGGATGEIVVLAHSTIYMHGQGILTSFTGMPLDPSVTSWVQVPPWYNAGLIGTVATPHLLTLCLNDMRQEYSTWTAASAAPAVNGVATQGYAPLLTKTPGPWIFALSGAPADVAAVDNVVFSPQATPAVCNNGKEMTFEPTAGPEGTLTFQYLATPPAPITAPPGAVQFPNPDHSQPG